MFSAAARHRDVVSRGHPIAQGMTCALLLNEGGGRFAHDAVHGSDASLVGTNQTFALAAGAPSVHGPGTGTSDYINIANLAQGFNDAWGLMFWFTRKTTGGFQGLARWNTGGGSSAIDIYTSNGSNNIIADVYNTGGSATTLTTTTGFTTGARSSYALVVRGGTMYHFLNGVKQTTTAATPARASGAGALRVQGGSNASMDEMHRVLVWGTRGPLQEEVISLDKDPDQILAPRTTPRFLVPGPGGTWKTVAVKVWIPA